jgi:drug/metabolite transporter (DMT)-like permease
MTLAVGLAVLAALLFGAGTACQAHVAGASDRSSRPGDAAGSLTSVGALTALMARPLWLVGTVLDWLGALTHIVALHFGPLTLVQPLSLTAIVFAVLVEATLAHRRLSRRQLLAAGQTALGLVLIALCLGPHSHSRHVRASTAFVGLAAVALGIAAVALSSGVCASRRVQALVLGAAAGSAYGLSDALARMIQVPDVTGFGVPVEILAGATALVAGAVGLVLSQVALQRRGLSSSMPTQDLLALLVSIAMGAVLLGEVPHLAGIGVVATAVSLGLTGHGIVRLSRLPSHVPAVDRPAVLAGGALPR